MKAVVVLGMLLLLAHTHTVHGSTACAYNFPYVKCSKPKTPPFQLVRSWRSCPAVTAGTCWCFNVYKVDYKERLPNSGCFQSLKAIVIDAASGCLKGGLIRPTWNGVPMRISTSDRYRASGGHGVCSARTYKLTLRRKSHIAFYKEMRSNKPAMFCFTTTYGCSTSGRYIQLSLYSGGSKDRRCCYDSAYSNWAAYPPGSSPSPSSSPGDWAPPEPPPFTEPSPVPFSADPSPLAPSPAASPADPPPDPPEDLDPPTDLSPLPPVV